MGLFDFWKRPATQETREDVMIDENAIKDPVLRALVGRDGIRRETVMNIPAVSACVNRIADTVASLRVKLYRRDGDIVEEVAEDPRVALLNDDTGDTLDGSQFKKAMVEDMFLGKGGYAYVNWVDGEVASVHFVEERHISFYRGTDPVFKDYRIQVGGKVYEGWQFIKLLRNTSNGYCGRSVIEESELLLNTVYASQEYEKNLVKTGGNKKGFLQSVGRLSKEAMATLKEAFRNLYSNNTENVVILNEGLSFKESSNTSVELQLNENKKTNNEEICKIFLIPPTIIHGGASEEDKKLYYEGCVIPILDRFATAIGRVMLTEEEKPSLFFSFDTTELVRGDIEKRFKAYEIACKNGFMQLDEVRKNEKLPAFGLDFIKLGLQDVLYYPKTNEIYTPNTNKISSIEGNKPGGQTQSMGNPAECGEDEEGMRGGETDDKN